jgi:uncharacterized membrane protein YphA (DoxX/SURF4 family)
VFLIFKIILTAISLPGAYLSFDVVNKRIKISMIQLRTSRTTIILTYLAQYVAACIMAQTLYFKFTGAPESVAIFTKLNMEPEGRIGVGMAELVAGLFLLISPTAWVGAALGAGLMAAAIYFHITILGIESQNDRGELFYFAVTILLCCLWVLFMRRQEVPWLSKLIK